ncbi:MULTISPECIES: outer membrane beta-barrel protein [unclassified Massilia]|uniref:outer membrane beta-barrel protein n=1 Tax=unclassified Massilia TaxID=2609279 RepID=UPI001B8204FE|nr:MULTISPECIES: outer membrane beta-barrel protein [unclassified Massilia]MBQ5939958.1 porin family protein [Massilia sp. AB1]MBQ5964285.1 porin family protein [Massilia sp. ZL223]
MSNLKLAGLAPVVSLLALVSVQANAAEPVKYWGVHAGANTLDEMNARIDFGSGTPFDGHADLKRGLHGGLMVGRQSEHARYELEVEQGLFKVERLSLGAVSEPKDARGRYQVLFANAYRTDRLSDSIDSFFGAGIGWGRIKLPRLGLGANCDCFGPASKSGFAWQVRAGLGYRVSEQASVSLQYTLLKLPTPEAGGPPEIRYERKRFGAVSLGYSRQF